MNAIQTEVSDGTLEVINVGLEYFKQSDISVLLDDSEIPLVVGDDYQWESSTSIRFLAGPLSNGTVVTLVRATESDSMLNIFDGGAPFSRAALDENFEQVLRLAQEFKDGVGINGFRQALNMHGYRVINVGTPTADQDASTKKYVDDLIQQIIDTGSGDFNFAVNVNYTDPAGGATNLQALSGANGPSLIGYGTGSLNDELLILKSAVRYVDTMTALATFPARANGDITRVARASSTTMTGGGSFRWDSASTATADGFFVVAVTGVPTGRWIRINDEVYASWFGARGDNSTDNTVPFAAIETYLRAELAAYRRLPKVLFEPGTYRVTTAPNWCIQGATFLNMGKVKFRGLGLGSVIILDAGPGVGINNVNLTFGQGTGFIVEGRGDATAPTVLIQNVYESEIRMRCWGAGVTQAAFHIKGPVLSTFYIAATPTESAKENPAEYVDGWYSSHLGGGKAKPQFGMILTESGTGAQASYNKFENWLGAACQYGMYIDSTLGNMFNGGDNEYNTVSGGIFTVNAIGNRVRGMNFEVNTVSDVECAGVYNSFDCDSVNFIFSGGSGNQLIGGMHNQINVAAGTGHYVGEVVYGRGLSGNLIIMDTAVRTSYGMCYQAQSQTWGRGPSSVIAVTVAASPMSYTNTFGNDVVLFVSGGTVGNISYFRGAALVGVVAAATNQQIVVKPGDTVVITYTVAPTSVNVMRG